MEDQSNRSESAEYSDSVNEYSDSNAEEEDPGLEIFLLQLITDVWKCCACDL